MNPNLQHATLAGGCFWCLEAVYQDLSGVAEVLPGYAGGHLPNPSYQQVCGGDTGHAEVVRLAFDPSVISYQDLLYVFWRIHDPTTLDRQGNDVGSQYRSAIFYETDEQRRLAERSLAETEASGLWPGKIVTEIAPLTAFYEAEPYHRNYFRLNPNQPYCTFVIDPKVRKFRKAFKEQLKETARA